MSGFDLFLSYNSRDRERVDRLAEGLLESADCVRCWLDVWSIAAASNWRVELDRALDGSTGAAVILGRNGWGPFHREEALRVLERKARDPSYIVIPVLLDGLAPKEVGDPQLSALFQGAQTVHLDEAATGEAVERISRAVRAPGVSPFPEGRSELTPVRVRRDARLWAAPQEAGDEKSHLYRGARLRKTRELMQRYPGQFDETAQRFVAASEAALRAQEKWRIRTLAAGLVVAALASVALLLLWFAADHARGVAVREKARAQLEEGLGLVERARNAFEERDYFTARLMLLRAIGFDGYGRPADAKPLGLVAAAREVFEKEGYVSLWRVLVEAIGLGGVGGREVDGEAAMLIPAGHEARGEVAHLLETEPGQDVLLAARTAFPGESQLVRYGPSGTVVAAGTSQEAWVWDLADQESSPRRAGSSPWEPQPLYSWRFDLGERVAEVFDSGSSGAKSHTVRIPIPDEALQTAENDDVPEELWSRVFGDGGSALLIVDNKFSSTVVWCSRQPAECLLVASKVTGEGAADTVLVDDSGFSTNRFERATLFEDRLVATIDSAGTARIYEREGLSYEWLSRFKSNAGEVTALVLGPRASLIAVLGERVQIFWTKTGRLAATLSGHRAAVTGLDFAPDERSVATVGKDGLLLIRDLPLESLVNNPPIESHTFSRDAYDPAKCAETVVPASPDPYPIETDHVDVWAGVGDEYGVGLIRIGGRILRVPDREPESAAMSRDAAVVCWSDEFSKEHCTAVALIRPGADYFTPFRRVSFGPSGVVLDAPTDNPTPSLLFSHPQPGLSAHYLALRCDPNRLDAALVAYYESLELTGAVAAVKGEEPPSVEASEGSLESGDGSPPSRVLVSTHGAS